MDSTNNFGSEGDEDVILESSPLNQYLQEIGMSDIPTFRTETSISRTQNKSSTSEDGDKQDTSLIVKGTDNSLLTILSNIVLFPSYFVWLLTTRNLQRRCVVTLNTFLSSKIFHANDEAILFTNYFREVYLEGMKEETRSPLFTRSTEAGTKSSLTVFVASAIIAWQFNTITKELTLFSLYGCLLLSSIFLICNIACSLVVHFIFYIKDLININNITKDLDIIAKLLHDYNLFLDKSILLINEVEIVSMGFVYPHPRPAVRNLKSHQKDPKRQFCTVLRTELQQSTTATVEEILTLYNKMSGEIGPYINSEQLSDFIATTSPEILKELTYSVKSNGETDRLLLLSTLKSYVNLFRFVSMEFAKLIAIYTVCPKQDASQTTQYNTVGSRSLTLYDNLCRIHDVLIPVLPGIQSRNTSYKNTLKFTQNYPFGYVPEGTALTDEQPVQKTAKYLATIHSAELHFKAVVSELQRMKELAPNGSQLEISDSLTSIISSISSCERNSVAGAICIDDLKDIVSIVDRHTNENVTFSSANDCLVVGQVTRKENGSHEEKAITPAPKEEEGDKLFEGLSDPCAEDEDNTVKDFFEGDIREHAKANKRLLTELRSIFAHKESPVGLISMDKVKEMKDSVTNADVDSNLGLEVRTDSKPELEESQEKERVDKQKSEYTDYAGDLCDTHGTESSHYPSEMSGALQKNRNYVTDKEERHPFCGDVDREAKDIHESNPFTFALSNAFSAAILEKSKVLGLKEETFGEDSDDDCNEDDE